MLRILRSRLSESDVSSMSMIVTSNVFLKIMSYLPQFRIFHATNSKMISFLRDLVTKTLEDLNFDQDDEPTNYVQAFYKAKVRDDNWTFTDDQLLASVFNLFVAGTDGTAITLRWSIFLMAHNPEWQERIFEEINQLSNGQVSISYADRSKMPLTDAAIMEIQRLANLSPLGFLRRTLAPSRLGGYDIPSGTIIVPLLTTVLGDRSVYPNPDRFDPTRFLGGIKNGGKGPEFAHLIPFSAGKRICLGESLARMELFIFFTSLMSKYRFYFPLNEPKPPLKGRISIFHTPPRFMICSEPRVQ